jgi:hypothetical protein
MVIWAISLPVYLLFGFLISGVVHTGPHDWFMLPGITIEHYYGHGFIVDDLKPHVLLPALAVCYGLTWYIFKWASTCGKKRTL